jgi:hypothetical protein
MKDVQVTGEGFIFFYFCGSFLPAPDPTKIIANPDSQHSGDPCTFASGFKTLIVSPPEDLKRKKADILLL